MTVPKTVVLVSLLGAILGSGCMEPPNAPTSLPPLTLAEGDIWSFTVEGEAVWLNVSVGPLYRVRGPDWQWNDAIVVTRELVGVFDQKQTAAEWIEIGSGEVILQGPVCLVTVTHCPSTVSLDWPPGPTTAMFGAPMLAGRTLGPELTISQRSHGFEYGLVLEQEAGRLAVRPTSDTPSTDSIGCNMFEHRVEIDLTTAEPVRCLVAEDGADFQITSKRVGNGAQAEFRGLGWFHTNVSEVLRPVSVDGFVPPGLEAVGPEDFPLSEAIRELSASDDAPIPMDAAALGKAVFSGRGEGCILSVCSQTARWTIRLLDPSGAQADATVTKDTRDGLTPADYDITWEETSHDWSGFGKPGALTNVSAAIRFAHESIGLDTGSVSMHARSYGGELMLQYFLSPAPCESCTTDVEVVQFDARTGELRMVAVTEGLARQLVQLRDDRS